MKINRNKNAIAIAVGTIITLASAQYISCHSNNLRSTHTIQPNSKMATKKIAVVTGGNKGIGYAIVKGLLEKYDGTVYLTSRDEKRGKEAVEKLKKLGLNAEFHQLDIDTQQSVITFRDYIKEKYGGLDLLVNNAAIAFKNDATESFDVQAEVTLRTNYFSLVRVCEALLPLVKQNGRVVNLSSSAGQLGKIPSKTLRKQLSDDGLTILKLGELMQNFIDSAKKGTNVADGWGNSAYVVSKVGVSALTRVQQRMLDAETPNSRNISVNSVHPGYVDTDMTSHDGVLTIEDGAKAPLYTALADHGLKGGYVWFNSTAVDWLSEKTLDVMQT